MQRIPSCCLTTSVTNNTNEDDYTSNMVQNEHPKKMKLQHRKQSWNWISLRTRRSSRHRKVEWIIGSVKLGLLHVRTLRERWPAFSILFHRAFFHAQKKGIQPNKHTRFLRGKKLNWTLAEINSKSRIA
jgi:hypothetical protein